MWAPTLTPSNTRRRALNKNSALVLARIAHLDDFAFGQAPGAFLSARWALDHH
jgi:hypothetical protein